MYVGLRQPRPKIQTHARPQPTHARPPPSGRLPPGIPRTHTAADDARPGGPNRTTGPTARPQGEGIFLQPLAPGRRQGGGEGGRGQGNFFGKRAFVSTTQRWRPREYIFYSLGRFLVLLVFCWFYKQTYGPRDFFSDSEDWFYHQR